jgi:hypothetical protein
VASANFTLNTTLQLMKVTELAESSYFCLIFKPSDAPWQTSGLFQLGAVSFSPI